MNNKFFQPGKHIAMMIGKDGTPDFLTYKNPKIWGPSYWQAFFMYASKYPIENPSIEKKNEMKKTFINIGDQLPCILCRISYKELLIKYPIDHYLNSRKQLLTWLYLIRDSVNRKLIIQERKELERSLKYIPKNMLEKRKKMEKIILYTSPSPSLQVILKRWM